MCANPEIVEPDLKSVSGVQDEGPPQTNAHATVNTTGSVNVTVAEVTGSLEDTIIKKRKTRRGKSKRRNPNPYTKLSWQQRKNLCNRQGPYNRNKFNNRTNVLNHALAPFNSNQFLMEDHGDLQELDDKLNKSDGAGTSTINPPRTRDSSFSVDSDGDFYSSPEDEEEFLTKEFDTAYENLQAERLQSMSKAELIEEYLQLENKVELLTKRLRGKSTTIASSTSNDIDDNPVKKEANVQEEINKLIVENDELRRENEHLRSGMCRTASSFSSSMDSESDSSSSTCNSSSTTSVEDEQMKEEIVENGIHEDASPTPTQTPTPTPTPSLSPSPSPTINDKSPPLSVEPSNPLIDNIL